MAHLKSKITFSVIMLNIFFLSASMGLTSTVNEIYSRPADISANFVDTKLIIKASPEIWNPSSSSFKINDSVLLNFGLSFSLDIINNTKAITYTEELVQTLVGYTQIPSGLSKQNVFTCTFTFSYNFSSSFQIDDLFKAKIDIYTVAPRLIPNHSRINGTAINILNNNLTTVSVNPDLWGNINPNATESFLSEPLVFMFVIVSIWKFKTKK